MKTSLSLSTGLLVVLTLGAWTVAPRACGQTAAGLSIQTHAGLTITGEVGKVFSIQYLTDLAQTNVPGAWRCLEFLQLPAKGYTRDDTCFWADKSAPATGRRFYRAVQIESPTNMVYIPPGTFRMGGPTNEQPVTDSPQMSVIISRGFFMGKHEVTQREYEAVTGTNPSWFNGVRDWPNPGTDYGTNLSRPVENVTWSDATDYCGRLTAQERAAGRIPTNSVYRLPTEAEWEYACRAWTSTRYSYGEDPSSTNLSAYGWYWDNSYQMTHGVGQKLPNLWGLHDMHGNVWEWCSDWHGQYGGRIKVDPQGPPVGTERSVRGGAYINVDWYCRSACRIGGNPANGEKSRGFRVVLAPSQP